MGLLRDRYIKDPNKKFWVTLAIDIFIIALLITVVLYAKGEFENGYNYCRERCLVYGGEELIIEQSNYSYQTHKAQPVFCNITSYGADECMET